MVKDPKRVKAGKRARNKGRAFEQRVARQLRDWGEWHVKRNRNDAQRGELGAAGEFYITGGAFPMPFCIEVKADESFRYEHLYADPIPGPLASTAKSEGFWDQARRQAATVKLRPLLIVKRNQCAPLAVLRWSDWLTLFAGPSKPHVFTRLVLDPNLVSFEVLAVLRWSDVLALPVIRLAELR